MVEKEFFRRDGTRVPVAVTVTLKPGSQEEAIVFALDLTALRQTEAAFRSSQNLQQRLVEQNPDAILTMTSGLIDYANPAAVRLYGARGTEDLLGKDTLDFLSEEERDQVLARRNQACIEDKCEHTSLVQRIQRLDGGEAIAEGKGLSLEQNPPRFMLVLRDITLRLKREEALRQSQRLESLGVLAIGIAHDFNNLLAALAGNLGFAQDAAGPDSPAGPYLATAGLAIERGSNLVNQLLAYAGQSPGSPTRLDLNTSVEDMIRVLSVSLPPRISLRRDLSQGLPSILADATQIQQVIMNLITNAADAIGEETGEIHLGTHRETLDESECRVGFAGQDLNSGTYLCLRVRDTGCGMSPEVIARIFDPFLTTKETGHGLGLPPSEASSKAMGAAFEAQAKGGWGPPSRSTSRKHDSGRFRPLSVLKVGLKTFGYVSDISCSSKIPPGRSHEKSSSCFSHSPHWPSLANRFLNQSKNCQTGNLFFTFSKKGFAGEGQ